MSPSPRRSRPRRADARPIRAGGGSQVGNEQPLATPVPALPPKPSGGPPSLPCHAPLVASGAHGSPPAASSSTAMTKMNLQIAHQVPGRVRMKIPAGKGNPELLQQISEVFRVIPGIEEITVNPATGSVVLHYDTDRHDEFHGTFQHHYSAHAGADGNGAATAGMHGADTELD